jgi:hypothetical protein
MVIKDASNAVDVPSLKINSTAVTSTAAELNILDGKSFVDEDDMSSNSATGIPSQQSVKAYVDNQQSMGDGFYLEDDDGTEVQITESKEVKIIGSGVTTNWTDTDNGTDGDPYDLTITVDAAQTGITSLLATDIKIGEDDQTKIDFETADEIHFYASNAEQVYVADGILGPETDSDVDLGSTSVRFKDAYVDSVTITDNATVGGNLTVNGTTTTVNSTVTTLVDPILTIGGNASDDNKDRGIEFKYNDGSARVGFFGWDDSATKFTFLTAATNSSEVFSGSTGTIVANVEGNLTGNVTGNASGTAATVTGAAQSNITSLGTLTTLTVDDVIINGSTIGHTGDTDLMTVASGVLTVAGEVDATSLDISGDADIDGTLEADAITVNGTALNTVIGDESTALAIALG